MLILWNRNNKIFSYIPCALGPNFVHLILTFCSFFFIIFFYFMFFFFLVLRYKLCTLGQYVVHEHRFACS